ncbi:UNVERIFIED_CONTAM: Internal alternative NAD(P)H-ubiquinone oxidoreductase A2, mitochondrial [Sesamum angustifolium]|uniref:Internal alternative NAD(P)H-ubiquinone oxidoreductase A2, mitochondrial n=1 Tax=Sesamum angustifolium TaxID=2727405 RepID=A0AAW2PEV9_9LAMI
MGMSDRWWISRVVICLLIIPRINGWGKDGHYVICKIAEVWDREIILTAAADYYGKDINLLQEDIEGNFTDGIWSADLASWRDCTDLVSCVNKYAAESINIACKWGTKTLNQETLFQSNCFVDIPEKSCSDVFRSGIFYTNRNCQLALRTLMMLELPSAVSRNFEGPGHCLYFSTYFGTFMKSINFFGTLNMALARIARNASRRHGGAMGTYTCERDVLCEGASAHKCPSFGGNITTSNQNVIAGSKLSFLSGIRTLGGMNFGSRGIRTAPQCQFAHAQTAMVESDLEYESRKYPTLEATKPGEKPRVVVLGSGWAACRFLKGLDTRLYDVVCISPRNHMVFTPLLASTCVGTLEFRSVAEPVSQIQSALAKEPNSYFFLASCTGIDTDKHEGVKEHAFFLREVTHAQEIRKRLLLNLMLCESPGISEEEKEQLLHCVVVGGGPTGVEFSGELSDFIMRDVRQRYMSSSYNSSMNQANEILSSFDVGLRQYATKHLTKYGVRLVRGVVKEVHPNKLVLSDGSDVPYGLLVWSTGVGPSTFVRSLDLPKSPGGRIGIDEWLRVPSVEDVFAIGDCAGFLEHVGRPVLPALAQVAEREGKFLVELFNRIGKQDGGRAFSANDIPLGIHLSTSISEAWPRSAATRLWLIFASPRFEIRNAGHFD